MNYCCCESLSCVQLFCDSMDSSPPGSSVHGIFQAGILGWVVISLNTFCMNLKSPSVAFNVPRLMEKACSAEVEHKALLQPVLGE